MHSYIHTMQHTYTRAKRDKSKVNSTCIAKLQRESSVSETGSDTHTADDGVVSADKIQDRSWTDMRYREDNQDRWAPCSSNAEAVTQ